jgi:hypothetical protein
MKGEYKIVFELKVDSQTTIIDNLEFIVNRTGEGHGISNLAITAKFD